MSIIKTTLTEAFIEWRAKRPLSPGKMTQDVAWDIEVFMERYFLTKHGRNIWVYIDEKKDTIRNGYLEVEVTTERKEVWKLSLEV